MRRRDFLKSMLAAGALPFLPRHAGAAGFAANGKVRLAAIGCGAQAWFDLKALAANSGLCEVVALCDTDIGAKHTLAALKAYPRLPRFRDFRKMFDKMAGAIDAVLVGTPDHSHFCATIHAIRLGKAVYVEKPLAHSFRECALLMEAERKCGIVCQMGNQGHSGDNYFQYRDYYARGELRDVVKVVAHMNMERRWHKWGGKVSGYPAAEPVPETLDWESWLSAAPRHDYSKDLVFGEWRCWFDYGMGCMGDWGAHILDTVHRFTLGGDLPAEVAISNLEGRNPYVFPVQDTITMKFPGNARHRAVTLEWWEGLHNQPPPPAGFAYDSNAGLFPASTANDGLVDPKLKPGKEIYMADGTIWQGLSHSSTLRKVGEKGKRKDFEKAGHDHNRNFQHAERAEDEAHSPIRVAAPLSQMFCLGVAAQRLGRGFKFDPAKGLSDDAGVNAVLRGPEPRKGWEDYYKEI